MNNAEPLLEPLLQDKLPPVIWIDFFELKRNKLLNLAAFCASPLEGDSMLLVLFGCRNHDSRVSKTLSSYLFYIPEFMDGTYRLLISVYR